MNSNIAAPEGRDNLWAIIAARLPGSAIIVGLVMIACAGAVGIFSANRFLATVRPSSVDLISRMAVAELDLSGDPNASVIALLEPRDSPNIANAARQALRADPLNPGLLRLLAFAQPTSENGRNFRNLTTLSEAVSRRDGLMQLWRITEASKNNNGPEMMAHIDTLLRARPEAAQLVFSALAQSLSDPVFRKVFAQSLSKRPPWLADFLIGTVSTTTRPDYVAMSLSGFSTLPRSPDLDSAWLQLLQKLADGGYDQALRSVFLRLPQASKAMLTSVALPKSDRDALLAPVAWQLIQNSDLTATLVSQGTNGEAVEFYLAGSKSGMGARKVVFLSPGQHTLSFSTVPDQGRPFVQLAARCLDSGKIVASSPSRPVARERREFVFTMAPGCAAVFVEIIITADETGQDSVFLVRDFTLVA